MPAECATRRSAPAAEVLNFYAGPSPLTSPGRYAAAFDGLPGDPAALARIVQGLVLHKFMAHAYGVKIPPDRDGEAHVRGAERMLAHILTRDDRPLQAARTPEDRLFGVCGHFTTLLVAMLRTQGIPARERAGFGAYFNPPCFEEHVLCEYWNADTGRWVLLDAQFDETWRTLLKIDHDPFDVPRDRFLTAAGAWDLCRSGKADPNLFGIFQGNKRGSWFLAAELIRDLAALNKMEVLVWDVWGAMPQPDAALDAAQWTYFDRLAALTREPDATFDELIAEYRRDTDLQVPPVVFNVIANRSETI